MSVREYIGARYVPVFADPAEWDATRTYEPLTVVTYQGNSYTSRQAVPANIPITNNTYWAQTGNYNAQVEQYRQEVAAFDGRIDELEDTVSPYTSSSTIQSAINAEASIRQNADSDLQTAINNEATARQNADNTLTTVSNNAINHGKIVILIGDSYGEGYTPDGSVEGWCSRAATYLAHSGITAKYSYLGGASLANGNFLARLQLVVNGMTDDEKQRCSHVIIGGGFNDKNSSEANINTGAQNIAHYIRDNLPHAKGILSFVGRCVTGIVTGVLAGATMNSVRNAAMLWYSAGTAAGLSVDLHGLACLNQNNLFSSDYVHPNANGLIRIAKHIVSLITGITSDISINDAAEPSGTFTPNNGWSINTNPQLLIGTNEYGFATSLLFGTTNNPQIELRRDEGIDITCSINGLHQIGTIYAASMAGTNLIVPISVVAYLSSGKYISLNGFMAHGDSGTIAISCPEINAEGNNYLTINATRLQIRPNLLAFR